MNLLKKNLINKSTKMIVCDMAGTTVNEGGIVYKTLYKTINNYGIHIEEDDIKSWYGVNKTEVLNHFINQDPNFSQKQGVLPILLNNFKNNLKESYFNDNNNIKLIHSELPTFFNYLRNNGVKVVLNSGFSKDIQESIINKLEMQNFIDGYISSEEVESGRPQPYMIHELMNRYNILDPQEIIKVGDSINDILEGKNANCYKSIGVLSGAESEENLRKADADLILNNVLDLRHYTNFD